MRFSVLVLAMMLATPAFAENCMSKANATAEMEWCKSYEVDIIQAKSKQIVRKLKAKNAEKKEFAAALDKAEAAWKEGIELQCGLIDAIDRSPTGAMDCMARLEREHALYLTDLLACDGYNYGITSNEMLDCPDEPRAKLEGALQFYNSRTNPAFGVAEDWKERNRFLKEIENEE